MDSITTKEHFMKNASEWVEYGHIKEGYNYPVGKHRNRIVKKIIKKNQSINSILDIGCGGGNLCIDLAKEGYKVKGIDESGEMIKIANKSIKKLGIGNNVSFAEKSLYDVKGDGKKYDAITSMGVIDYLDSDNILFDIANRKLYKGGKFIVSCRNRLFNLFPTSHYFKDETGSLHSMRMLLDEINELKGDISNESMSRFSESLRLINLDKYLVKREARREAKSTINKDPGFTYRQHTPNEILQSAQESGFERTDIFGVHPHLLPPVMNDMLPCGLYNEISSILEPLESLPISLIWSSVFISVFEKK
jgi:SAM-dependent methyltransferase